MRSLPCGGRDDLPPIGGHGDAQCVEDAAEQLVELVGRREEATATEPRLLTEACSRSCQWP